MILGAALALTAALGFASSAVFARLGLQHMRPTTGVFISLLVGIAITMALALALHWDDILALSAIAFAWFLLYGVLNFTAARLLNFMSVNKIGVSRAAPIIGGAPLFTAAIAVSIGTESVNLYILAGTIIIVAGIALIVGKQ